MRGLGGTRIFTDALPEYAVAIGSDAARVPSIVYPPEDAKD